MRSGLAKLVIIGAVMLAPLGLFSQSALSQASPEAVPAVAKTAPEIDHGRVILLLGLANVFSRGMDTLSEELVARGVDASSMNFGYAFEIADSLAEAYQTDKSVLPIIIIGHSLGANRALSMSAHLAEKNIPVRLVVLFDGTVPWPVPVNVEEVLNLYRPDGACVVQSCTGVTVVGAPGFEGIINNKDVSQIPGTGHLSIDKSPILHEEVIEKVLSVLAEK